MDVEIFDSSRNFERVFKLSSAARMTDIRLEDNYVFLVSEVFVWGNAGYDEDDEEEENGEDEGELASLNIYSIKTGDFMRELCPVPYPDALYYNDEKNLLLIGNSINVVLFHDCDELFGIPEIEHELFQVNLSDRQNPFDCHALKTFHPQKKGVDAPYYYVIALHRNTILLALIAAFTHVVIKSNRILVHDSIADLSDGRDKIFIDPVFLPQREPNILSVIFPERKLHSGASSHRVFLGVICFPEPDTPAELVSLDKSLLKGEAFQESSYRYNVADADYKDVSFFMAAHGRSFDVISLSS